MNIDICISRAIYRTLKGYGVERMTRWTLMRILEEAPVPVVPMALSGLWQSLFARNRDKLRHAMRGAWK